MNINDLDRKVEKAKELEIKLQEKKAANLDSLKLEFLQKYTTIVEKYNSANDYYLKNRLQGLLRYKDDDPFIIDNNIVINEDHGNLTLNSFTKKTASEPSRIIAFVEDDVIVSVLDPDQLINFLQSIIIIADMDMASFYKAVDQRLKQNIQRLEEEAKKY